MWKRLLLLLVMVQPLAAEGRYSATLGPSESVTLTLEKDHSFKLVWHEGVKEIQATASGRFEWTRDDLDLKVGDILFVGSKDHAADRFDLEIRRKGVDGPPPTLRVEAGQEIHLKIQTAGDSLQLRRAPDWDLTLYLKH